MHVVKHNWLTWLGPSPIFKHIPTNAYTNLAEMFQQEFKHSKFKHHGGVAQAPQEGCCPW